MPRTTRGPTAFRRHRKITARTRGFRGRRKNVFRVARQALMKADQYAYRDRRDRKRQMRSVWIVRVNAAARQAGLTYRTFMHGLGQAGLPIDRKMLAELALHNPKAFAKLAEHAKNALAAS
ncbi:MAG: 50S ribosomal protein L20 [Betaproteobacteria bacterium]|nr:50S ribosomal protein L20 [Betaproteobacteria bacterium]